MASTLVRHSTFFADSFRDELAAILRNAQGWNMKSASGEFRKGGRESLPPSNVATGSQPQLPESIRIQPAPSGRSDDRSHATAVQVDLRIGGLRLVTGNAGDHTLIHALLRAANQSPSYEDFLSWLDEPTYEPTDRLLVKHEGRIVAHVQILHRLAWFGGVRLPVGGLQDLAILPEHREARREHLLLAGGEQTMRDHHAVVAYAYTDRPEVFHTAGWFAARGQSCTQANVNDILALLSSFQFQHSRSARSLRTRLWRHVELDPLQAVGRNAYHSAWGALDRTEPYWRWLVNRKAHDELIVAVHGKDNWSELDSPAHIVGYTVMHGPRVIELATLPDFPSAAPWMLARACQDAIEQDHRSLSLHLASNHPLHERVLSAGGEWCSGNRGNGQLMLKLLDPARWVECMYPVILHRAKAANLARPLRLVFDIGGCLYRLEVTRRSGHLIRDDNAEPDVHCSPNVFASLLLSNLDTAASRATGELQIADDATARIIAALFPFIPFWQSQLDSLRL